MRAIVGFENVYEAEDEGEVTRSVKKKNQKTQRKIGNAYQDLGRHYRDCQRIQRTAIDDGPHGGMNRRGSLTFNQRVGEFNAEKAGYAKDKSSVQEQP